MAVSPDPVSMRGAVDLAALAAQQQRAASKPANSTSIELTEENLQEVAQRSAQVPIVIAFVSATSPASGELAARLDVLVAEYAGKFLAAQCDVDAQPGIAQAFQVQAVPAVMALIGARPAPLFQGSASDEQIREVLDQVLDVAAQAGVTGTGAAPDAPVEAASEPEAEPLPPLHQEAFDAIESGNYEAAEAAYDRALVENPKDADARAGRAQVRLMSRTLTADLGAVRAAAAERPDDPAAQMAVADMDVAGGQVEDAFVRLLDTVRVTQGDEREEIRQRLLELFDVVGGADPRVLKARQALASALY
ncbi:tetratricopeptide repeat protein [Demequina aurantiaca]|uniref:tetratricopeptide repeat protein n=1 Tax=Demequina aurantiaca TaxID=676200 RepID=UPI000783DC05|nr:tetratricopeptide repeat protein [Demequina aurantiaca]